MSKFGWSYPPGCSGPPDEPEKSCGTCACSELEHDVVNEETGELGKCLNKDCECEKFTDPPLVPEPDICPEDYEPNWEADGEDQSKWGGVSIPGARLNE